jgi:4-diphosphocytidyl-2-C-methyl-D-erythritol kinase
MLTIRAPAKINLTLEILGRRDDGYHEILSVIQAISLCDVLHLEKATTIELNATIPDWLPEKSLIPGAIRLLQDATGCARGVKISLDKHLPLISGLGGDSSDAAAVLLGLNQLWELDLSIGELEKMAATLGSDVAFFLHGGTALLEGRGEKVTPLPPFPRQWAVLVIPPVPRLTGKTEQLYKSVKPTHYTDGEITRRLVNATREGKEVTPTMFFNTFENLVFQPGSDIETCRQHLIKIGAEDVHLAGSGPTLFTLFKDKTQAEDLCARLRNQNLETYLAETIQP